MVGGGEYSFLDLLVNLPQEWKPYAAVPMKGKLQTMLDQKEILSSLVPLVPIRPWRIPQMLFTIRKCIRLASFLRPSLIYANGSRAAFYAAIAGRILGTPVVWHCRITEPDPYLDPLLLRLCTVIVANSHATSARFSAQFQPKVRVVYNGIDIEHLRASSAKAHSFPADDKIILVVAGIHRSKRHDTLLKAFQKVASLDRTLRLVFIGSKNQSDRSWWAFLDKMTRQSPFRDRIHWLGAVEDLRPWYRAAWVLILASESESFGRVLVEAMGSGTPVIATTVGGIPEIVRDGQEGLLFSPGGSEQLANAIKRLLEEESLRIRLAQAAFRRADSFGLELHIQNMLKIFNEVCGYA
jgi:glycosyltransferase involved in cell wall biosynthesis